MFCEGVAMFFPTWVTVTEARLLVGSPQATALHRARGGSRRRSLQNGSPAESGCSPGFEEVNLHNSSDAHS